MTFQTYEPTEALRPYIRQYGYILAEGSTDLMPAPESDRRFVDGLHVETIMPTLGHLIFVRGAEVQVGDLHKPEQKGIFVIGASTEVTNVVTLHGWFECMFVDFQPGGMRALLGYDMIKLKGQVVGTEDMQDQSLHEVGLRICQEDDARLCVPMLDGFFLGRLNPKLTTYEPTIKHVSEALRESKGNMTITEMASVACLSERQFRRIFAEYVGLTPKEFTRVQRFHYALQYMQHLAQQGQTIDLLEVAMRFGYYDVSHMAAEFRAIGCTKPSQFRHLGIPLQKDFTLFFG